MSIPYTSANLQLDTKRHSFAHLMACAVQIYFREIEMAQNAKNQKLGISTNNSSANSQVQFGVGPVIDNGCYYDFILPRPLIPEDLPKIEKVIQKLLKQDLSFKRLEIDLNEAIKLFADSGQPLKVELLENLRDKGTTSLSEEERADFERGNFSNKENLGKQEIKIRKGELVDLDSILEIQKNGWKDICHEVLGITKEDVNYLFENNFEKNSHKNFAVACISEKIVGVICAGSDGEIHGFFVDSAYRKKGIGRKLLDFIIPEIKTKFGEIKVGSLVKNTNATQFYKNYGFVGADIRKVNLDLENKKCFAEEEILILSESKVLEILKSQLDGEDYAENSPREGWQPQVDGVLSTQEKFDKYKNLPYNTKLAEKAQELRKAGVLSEVLFWEKVKNNQLQNLDFERQKIIGNYIVDFYCPELGLVVEIDGESHDFKGERDLKRENYLKSLGLNIVHFEDVRIKKDLDNVMNEIQDLVFKLKQETPRQALPVTPHEGNLPKITFYRITDEKTGEIIFEDLCKGPHIEHVKELKGFGFALDKFSASYWRGDQERNIQMQRLYALVFETKEELQTFQTTREEAKKRDHKILGRQLEWFFFDETAPGMPYFLPQGLIIKNKLIDFWRQDHFKRGYTEYSSPLISKQTLFETSGHWEHYRDDMMITKSKGEDIEWGIKAMSCPNACTIYKVKPRSYKDLPLRLSDLDTLHRNENPGSLNGLFRVRVFNQDDSHNFITPEQVELEMSNIIDIVYDFYKLFGMENKVKLYLSTMPDEHLGQEETWKKAEDIIEKILKKSQFDYGIKDKDGAFYGPKIDIHLTDALGRDWQCGTVQLDYQLPERFDLWYADEFGNKQRPVIIHRVIYGSLDRFLGILIEHTAGRLPFWLAPTQLKILTINNSEEVVDYVSKIKEILTEIVLMKPLKYNEIRFEVDDRQESLGKKIREGEMSKIPVLLIVGPKDIAENQVSVRTQSGEEKVWLDSLGEFLQGLK